MENKFHKSLTLERWSRFSKEEQILNIVAEFARTKNWLLKKQPKEAVSCLDRAFELLDLTLNDPKWGRGLKELLRFREVLASFYIKEKKDLSEFLAIFKVLLYFTKFTSQVNF